VCYGGASNPVATDSNQSAAGGGGWAAAAYFLHSRCLIA